MADGNSHSIADVDSLVSALPPGEKELFDRIFKLQVSLGQLRPPETMRAWIEDQFGSVDAVKNQKVVRITNLVTFEGAIFNVLRASRPMELTGRLAIEIDRRKDPLDRPLEGTPEDVFGRVWGRHSVTASNIAKYDTFHGLVIFDDYDPLGFTKERVVDYISTAEEWGRRAHRADPESKYFFFMWNCLWRAGSTLLHGHAQMSLGREMHYAKVEHLRRCALDYRNRYGSSYFDDLFRVHASLGLGFQADGLRAMAHLSPIKEKEIVLIAPSLNQSLKERIYEALACLRDDLGIHSFNLAIYMPPLAPVEEDWSAFPVVVRMVDRGNHESRASDFGAMELYAQSVVASDPFLVARALKNALARP